MAVRSNHHTFVGKIIDHAGGTAPFGTLLCDGSQQLISQYPNLYAIIGTTYGPTDGTYFTLPDFRGRVTAGLDTQVSGIYANRLTSGNSGITASTLGANGGLEVHTLTVNQMPSHDHGAITGNDSPDHTHNYTQGRNVSGMADYASYVLNSTITAATAGASNKHQHSISAQGGGTAHNNTQPTLVVLKVISYV
jgi:microcystin-dependent protein